MTKAVIKLTDLPKHERISELLRQLCHDIIDIESFWIEMRKYGLTDEDIDTFCSGKHVT